MAAAKYKILFCDDELDQCRAFARKHNNTTYEVSTETSVDSLPQKLAEMKKLPDLLVIDLYYPLESVDPGESKKIHEETKVTIADITRLMGVARQQISSAYGPRAIQVVREIRQNSRLVSLPILFYTRYGISTVYDAEMMDAISTNAGWMLKGRPDAVEQRIMYQMIFSAQLKSRVPRDIRLAVWSSIGSALLGYFLGRFL